ncbi:MAG: 50S ribosome-binding GTPase [Phycisphaerales bacterium]|jgi:tRNA modification GTPase|nr:50S ribosome-binding GTPase [Phycisphaerales bacterium]
MDLESTIVAISTARTTSKKSLLRISGSRALEGVSSLGLHPKIGECLVARVAFESTSLPVLITAFKKNASYTGEDLVEIQFAGNQHVANRLLTVCMKATGGREAIAGEFTARAFFSGRITLAQAEGVCATISASNDAELSAAALLREGVLTKLTKPITTKVTKTLGLVEAGIDFTDEEDVVAISENDLVRTLEQSIEALRSIANKTIPMSSLRTIPTVVLAGNPNSGKSTLFNALLGKKRVVVSQTSGTTRDAIREEVWFGPVKATLVDVAGFDTMSCELSRSAQVTAKNTIASADVVLFCVSPNDPTPVPSDNSIIVRTMADLREHGQNAVSARTGVGINKLVEEISQALTNRKQPSVESVAMLPRHEKQFSVALHSLLEAKQHSSVPELCAASLRDCLAALGQITGTVAPDDVLDHVFASFCVGK